MAGRVVSMSVPKQFVFAASSEGEPWWVLGQVTARALAPLGYQVQVEPRSASNENARWVSRGDALIGATLPYLVCWAREGKFMYEGEQHADLVALAAIEHFTWEAIAVRAELGVTSLGQLRERQLPLRVLSGRAEVVSGRVPRRILEHHGLSQSQIEAWGGKFLLMSGHPHSSVVREGDFDLIATAIYLGNSAVTSYWNEASILYNLRFLQADAAAIRSVIEEFGFSEGLLPCGLVRGVDRDIPSVMRRSTIIYGRRDLDDEFATTLVRALDEQRELFHETRIRLVYNPATVARSIVPFHPAAERYYRERGYLD
jgi:TRAP-type uncharacterized transport system substrate-binding protein